MTFKMIHLMEQLRRMIVFKTFRNSKRDRLPTRQPNPSVYNRNALLARENRRKKKAQLEILEKDLQEAINTNNKLLKELNKQLKLVQKLEKEKIYYKSVLMKQPKIQRLLSALNCRLDQNSTHNINFGYDQQELLKIAAGAHRGSMSSHYSSSIEQDGSVLSSETPHLSAAEKLTVERDLFLSSYQSSINIPCESYTDASPFSFFSNDWDNLYDIKGESVVEDIIHEKGDKAIEPTTDDFSFNNVWTDDHSYVSSSDKTKSSENVGFCIHIGEDKVTLDFCPSCHARALNDLC